MRSEVIILALLICSIDSKLTLKLYKENLKVNSGVTNYDNKQYYTTIWVGSNSQPLHLSLSA